MDTIINHERLLIESYALGYVAQKIDAYSPTYEYVINESDSPSINSHFVQLMRESGIMSESRNVIFMKQRLRYGQYADGYRLGYLDSLFGNKSKVTIYDRCLDNKVWNYPVHIAHLSQH